MVAEEIGGGRIRVRIEELEDNKEGYAPTLHMNLDTTKLKRLGWKPKTGLPEMYRKMIASMKES